MDGPDYLQRCVLPFSMWPFLITAWLGQGSSSTDISVAELGVYVSYDADDMSFLSLVCYVALSGMLTGETAAACGCM